jgi:hypothetical protein
MLQYIIKLSISLSLVYLFYQLFLRRLTFYNWNRWYLLIYSMVCFVIPFINVFTIIVERPALRESAIINYIPAITQISPVAAEAVAPVPSSGINRVQVAVIVFLAGVLFMLVRLLLQYYSLYKMRSKAVLLYDEKVKLYHIDEPVMPFSFGRGIYVNQHQHSEHELKEIIRHEFIHVKQRHSLDILWSELLCILNWYNPFAWLLRHDIRQNLEFIADQQVLQTGLDRKQYQYLLLKVIGVNSFSIATNFNFSSLKRRIAMMNKAKSARVHLIRFLFLLPLLVVVLLAFRNSTQGKQPPVKGVTTDTIPAAPKTPAGWKDINTIDVTDQQKVTIRLKNGKTEKYDLVNAKEKEAFEKKYGALPEPPTPLVPVMPDNNERPENPEAPEKPERPEAPEKREAPETPERAEAPEAPEPPEAPEAPEKAPYTIDLQDCLNKKGYCITVADNYGECVVIVKDKNNKIVEAVVLTDWDKDKKYAEKYGEIPPRQIQLMPKYKTGQPAKARTATKGEAVKEVIVMGRPAEAKMAIASKVAADPKALAELKAEPKEVVVIGKPMEVKIAKASKLATEPSATLPIKSVPAGTIVGKPVGVKAIAPELNKVGKIERKPAQKAELILVEKVERKPAQKAELILIEKVEGKPASKASAEPAKAAEKPLSLTEVRIVEKIKPKPATEPKKTTSGQEQ